MNTREARITDFVRTLRLKGYDVDEYDTYQFVVYGFAFNVHVHVGILDYTVIVINKDTNDIERFTEYYRRFNSVLRYVEYCVNR